MDMNSGFTLSQTDGRPMYLQIIEQVKQRVAVGDWPPGSMIPSIRALAVELKISVITIKRAYLELEREGVIVTRQGKGSQVAPNPELGEDLRGQELAEHLEKSVRLAESLGIEREDLRDRLEAAWDRVEKERS